MKGAKAVNLISRIVRIIGIVLILVSLVLFLYAAINTGGRWGELDKDMKSFGVDLNLIDRARFDDRLFSAMSAVARENASGGKSTATGDLSQEQIEKMGRIAVPYFSPYYDRARSGLTAYYAEESEEVYRWFETEFDAEAFLAENENIEAVLRNHEIGEVFEFLRDLYKPKKVALGKPDQRPFFEDFYQEYRAQHGNEAGSWYEYVCALRLMVQSELDAGAKITSEARVWYASAIQKDDFDARYQEALARVREQEAREGDDNYIVQLIDLCKRRQNGEKADWRAFLDAYRADLIKTYPEVDYSDPHIFLAAVRDLTRSIMPGEAEESGTDAGDGAAAAEDNGTEAAPADEEAAAGETAEEETEEAEAEEIVLDPNRFDGSYIKVRDEMVRMREGEVKNNPDAKQTLFVATVIKDACDRASIGILVSYFWAAAAKYLLIFFVGLLLVILAYAANRIMQHVLLNRSDIDEEMKQALAAREETAAEQPEAFGDDVLLRVSHLKQYFRSGSYINKAVDDVSFYVKKGEVFGLVGESGCGKTTTGRTIINLYDPTEGDVYFEGLRVSSNLNGLPVLKRSLNNDAKQAIEIEKAKLKEAIARDPARKSELTETYEKKVRDIREKLRRELENASTNALISFVEKGRAVNRYRQRRQAELTEQYEAEKVHLTGEALAQRTARYKQDMKVAGKDNIMSKMQMIFQDPIASINPRMTVREIIAEGLVIQGVKDKEYINEKVYEMLELVGLVHEHADGYPHEFSGGQRQRIGIARAIIMNPDLIIADEPISALDVSIQAQVINLLNDLRNQMGLTIMFIAHNLSVVKYFSDRIAVMYYGKIVEMTTSDELFAHPLHPYTKSLLSAIPYPDPHYEKARQRIEYNPAKAHDYSVDKPSLREITPGHYIHCNNAEFESYKKELGL